jgi:hypothetical protein
MPLGSNMVKWSEILVWFFLFDFSCDIGCQNMANVKMYEEKEKEKETHPQRGEAGSLKCATPSRKEMRQD